MKVIVGDVLSILMLFAVTGLLTRPAKSVHVPDRDWFTLSVETVVGGVHEAMPETASAPVKVTTTSVLFQPLAFGVGDFVALAVGLVKSILKTTVVEPEFPARSVHVLVWT